jgi:cytochrome c556
MSLKTISTAVAMIAVGALAAGAAFAQAPATPAQKARHEHFHDIGKAFKGILDELKAPAPSIAVLQTNAKSIDELASQLPGWFPAGTGPEAGKTQALPTIWQKPDEFKKDAADFATAAHATNLAAQSGNVDAVKGSLAALGGACKTCHTVFRAKDEH